MKKLRLSFLAFFVLLAVPCSILLWKAYDNLERESFSFWRGTAERAIDDFRRDFFDKLAREEARPFTQYRYIHVADQAVPRQEGLNLSPLAAFPVVSEFPGALGYFQIDPDGALKTPLLPDGEFAAVEVADREARLEVRDRIAALLGQEEFRSWTRARLDEAAAPADSKAEADSRLKSNLVTMVDSSLEDRYARKDSPQPAAASKSQEEAELFSRKVQKSSPRQSEVFDSEARRREAFGEKRESAAPPGALAGAVVAGADETTARDADQYRAVPGLASDDLDAAAEVDPFQTKTVGNQWLVFHRNVWWSGRRYVQGFALSLDGLLEGMLAPALERGGLPADWSGLVFYRGQPVRSLGRRLAEGERPALLFRSDLPRPLDDWTVAVAVPRLPPGPGRGLLHVVAAFLGVLLVGGLFGMYRLSASQIELSQKKNDFVAAVSHELKTPLASIRMYGEMLMEGWVEDEEKRQTYYRHIHDESERLSRLIQNVLRLAELERDEWRIDPVSADPAEFLRASAEKLRRQVESAGFELAVEVEGSPSEIRLDRDATTQILVNLIDNALKFARQAESKKIALSVDQSGDRCAIRVRDFGPGIPRRHLKKIFEKFYRVDAEMTRKTQGSGIGLALVKMLAEAMGARVEAVNRQPGAEFIVWFPVAGRRRQVNIPGGPF